MAISKNQIILLGGDGCIFGLGDNSLGELGLCHCDCVTKPVPLVFFYKLNNKVAKQLCDGLAHPVEKNCRRNGPCGNGACGGGFQNGDGGKKYSPNNRCCGSSGSKGRKY